MTVIIPGLHTDAGPKGDQRLASIDTATALTVPAGANMAVFQAETQNARIVFDGSTPTATKGYLLVVNATGLVFHGDLTQIRVISAVAGAAVNVSYFAA